MKTILSTLAVAGLVALAAPADAGYRRGNGYRDAGPSPCLPGYQFYPREQECIKNGPIGPGTPLAEKAKCTPKEIRRVPDPDKPGAFKIQTCGYVKPSRDP